MTWYRLTGGKIVDPATGRDHAREDLWIHDGKIVAPPAQPEQQPVVTHDLHGGIVMPGGVDMHCHIAGPKVNQARGFLAGVSGRNHSRIQRNFPVVPHCQATGQLFAGLGYTTAVDAAIPGLSSRLAHHEFAITPDIDKAFLTLFGNNHYVMEQIRNQHQSALQEYCDWMLHSVHAWGVKVVNPGGVENWKQIQRQTRQQFDQPVGEFGVSPRQIVQALSTAVDELKLPHAIHIHCNNLGYPGNWETTLQTMQALEGKRGHFAHIQFHSYAGTPDDPGSFSSAVEQLVDYVAAHPEITVDVGHVSPGSAFTITGDAPFAEHLHRLSGGRWYTSDTEMESSCGILPAAFKPYKNIVHATQWAIGLEWYLRMPDPWRIAMSSDHPNGGAFTRYPEMIELLMKQDARLEMLAQMPAQLRDRSLLAEIDREYSLYEIAIITRAAPARILGMKQKGNLAVGADADITVYQPQASITEMFQRPDRVYQRGRLIVEQGERRRVDSDDFNSGLLISTASSLDRKDEHEQSRREWFNQNYSLRYGNYQIAEEQSPCRLLKTVVTSNRN